MVFELNKVRSRASASPPPRVPVTPTRPITVGPAAERPVGAVAERPSPTTIGVPGRRGPAPIRGWTVMHFLAFAALVAISLLCAAMLYRELTEPAPAPSKAAAGQATVTAPVAPPAGAPASFAMPPLQAYAEVTARPLFSPGRRPPSVSQQVAGPASSLALVGVVISRDGRIALIRQGKAPAAARVQEGQLVDGWTVKSIAADRVVVRSGATEAELKLHEDAPAKIAR